MKTDVICKGDTVEDAINNGLKEMNLSINEVDYEVIEEGNKILNVVLKPYRVRLTKKEKYNKPIDYTTISKDAEIEIEISKDQMSVYITILPPVGGKMITKEDIEKLLWDKNIVYGIIHKNINNIIDNMKFNTKELVAKGDPPINGIDGEIIYYFDSNKNLKPKVLENGNVDFKELNIVENVIKGDVLAKKTLPTEGTDGKTVTGKVLKAKPGKQVYFKKGRNVEENDDCTLLIASEDGCPKIIDEKITVFQVYEISGNVDNSTGNLYFNGKIVVRGNVCTGFRIESEGDVEVFGVVEGAEIYAEGDILLHKGIQGQNLGKLYSKKNITAGYMESCYARAQGSIYADVVLHCILECKDSIYVLGKKGMLVGGEARANVEISAISIGSPMTTATKLEVGIDPELKQNIDNLKQEQETLYKNRESVTKAIELLTKLAKSVGLNNEKQEILDKSISTKEYLEDKIKNVNTLLLKLQQDIQTLSNGRINVNNIVYPGVRIAIGSSALFVRDSIKHATIIKEDGEIKTTVYMGK